MDAAENAIARALGIFLPQLPVLRRKKRYIFLMCRAGRFRRHRAVKKEAPAVLWSRAGAFS
jgi:hypothetical protein